MFYFCSFQISVTFLGNQSFRPLEFTFLHEKCDFSADIGHMFTVLLILIGVVLAGQQHVDA